ncbi:MAG: spondin domain-containing protein [Pseudomonadota bacterium]
MKIQRAAISVAIAGVLASSAAIADDKYDDDYGRSIPSVVVTVENGAPSRGAVQTPVWVGIHDGSFDLYDRNVPLGAEGLVAAPAVERLAEDGATGPLSDAFAGTLPNAPQTTIFGPTGPLVPGDRGATTLQVDPANDRFFSYASMVVPSNDAFIANGSPVAHELFNERGRFVGTRFAVAGTEVLDAGTEVNDEVAGNTAFLAQAAPDTGITEQLGVVLHEGFRRDVAFPDGVLSQPIFALADFLAPTYRAAEFSFRYVDLGRTTRFRSALKASNEVSAELVDSNGRGNAELISSNGESLEVEIDFRRTTGPVIMAHLHFGQEGTNGPVVANLTPGVSGNKVRATISRYDVVGPLAEGDDPYLNLLNELAAGNIYINLHTAANPAGELRGQVSLRGN